MAEGGHQGHLIISAMNSRPLVRAVFHIRALAGTSNVHCDLPAARCASQSLLLEEKVSRRVHAIAATDEVEGRYCCLCPEG